VVQQVNVEPCDSVPPDIALPPHLPSPCPVRWLLERRLDIGGLPRRYFWELLAHFTESALERDKFREFLTPQGQDELYDYCHRPRRNITEVGRLGLGA
jgi:sulfite reductase alpha subunit-like flavoprotein